MELRFTALDYFLFGGMLGLSTLIGVYFGFFSKRKQDNPDEYLMGSKQLKVFPVAMSLTATHISAVTVLGVPVEMYLHGTQYWATAISGLLVTIAMAYIYLPVFYELQSTTMYAYLERRFDHRQRTLASGLFCLASILYLPIMIYAPAIAFNQVTGINLHVITPIMSIICIFYTTFGGIRAVVWADTLQFVAMIGSIGAVMILGTISVGGLDKLYAINNEGGRIIWFNMDPDPTTRSTFWSITVGLTALWITGIGVTPECIQRFRSVPTYQDAKNILWVFCFGHIAVKMFAVFCGVIIYARYQTCDPYTIGEIKKPDQIFPYYVMDIAQAVPGLPGLFVAGVFSAALSSMSSMLNVLSGTIYGDFLKPKFPKTTEKTASNIMKILVVLIGCFAIGMVFVVERLGNMFSLAISIVGVTSGTLLGMFTMGMLIPKANRHGAFWGSIVSLIVVGILTTGAQLAIANKQLNYEMLPLRTDGCAAKGYPDYMNSTKFIGNPNTTTHIYNQNADNSAVPWFFRLGFMYYSLLGTLLVFIIGYPISLYTGGYEITDERLFAPFVRKMINIDNRKRKEKEAEASTLKPLNEMKTFVGDELHSTDDDNEPKSNFRDLADNKSDNDAV